MVILLHNLQYLFPALATVVTYRLYKVVSFVHVWFLLLVVYLQILLNSYFLSYFSSFYLSYFLSFSITLLLTVVISIFFEKVFIRPFSRAHFIVRTSISLIISAETLNLVNFFLQKVVVKNHEITAQNSYLLSGIFTKHALLYTAMVILFVYYLFFIYLQRKRSILNMASKFEKKYLSLLGEEHNKINKFTYGFAVVVSSFGAFFVLFFNNIDKNFIINNFQNEFLLKVLALAFVGSLWNWQGVIWGYIIISIVGYLANIFFGFDSNHVVIFVVTAFLIVFFTKGGIYKNTIIEKIFFKERWFDNAELSINPANKGARVLFLFLLGLGFIPLFAGDGSISHIFFKAMVWTTFALSFYITFMYLNLLHFGQGFWFLIGYLFAFFIPSVFFGMLIFSVTCAIVFAFAFYLFRFAYNYFKYYLFVFLSLLTSVLLSVALLLYNKGFLQAEYSFNLTYLFYVQLFLLGLICLFIFILNTGIFKTYIAFLKFATVSKHTLSIQVSNHKSVIFAIAAVFAALSGNILGIYVISSHVSGLYALQYGHYNLPVVLMAVGGLKHLGFVVLGYFLPYIVENFGNIWSVCLYGFLIIWLYLVYIKRGLKKIVSAKA